MKFLVAVLGIVGLIAVVASRDANAYTYFYPKLTVPVISYRCGNPVLEQAVYNWGEVSGLRVAGCTNSYPNIDFQFATRAELGGAGCRTYRGSHPDLRVIKCVPEYFDPAINADSMEAIATHEVGHALGLGHSPGGIMAEQPCQKPSPEVNTNCLGMSADDIAGIRSLYGPFSLTPTATPTRQCF